VSHARIAVVALMSVSLASTATGQERTFALKFKNDKGTLLPFYQEVNRDVTLHSKARGQDLWLSQQKSTFWYAWTPVKEEKIKDGADEFVRWTLKMRTEGLKLDVDLLSDPIKYDSRTPAALGSAGTPGLVELFKSLRDSEFTVPLGKNYKVEEVAGREEFIKRLLAGGSQELLAKLTADDVLKEMTDPTYKLLPEGPKKKGDKWERKTSLNLGPIGSYELTYKFTYLEPDKDGDKKDFDKIEVETVTNTAPKEPAEGPTFRYKDGKLISDPAWQFRYKDGSKLISDPEGSQGVVYYDPKVQRIAEATINIKLRGDLIMVIRGGT